MREPVLYERTATSKICGEIDKLFRNTKIFYRKSLSPLKHDATTYFELGRELYLEEKNDKVCYDFCKTFFHITKAELYHFPGNIFWDMDFIFFSTFAEMKKYESNYKDYLIDFEKIMLKLLHVFGGHSAIKFQYIHDFSYGFDWAKWVKKDKKERKSIGPFSLSFLHRMFHRGEELIELIRKNDAKYYQLGKKERFRNPFIFIREPEEETALLTFLAKEGNIPVACWDKKAKPKWEIAYEIKRRQASEHLGIIK